MVDKKDRIAIIPARGGSKRIPDKNIIDFHGKPMIAWTIESAIQSGLFDQVIVSTDSEKIAQISIRYGAHIPFLRKEFVDDHSPISFVTIDALNNIQPKKYKIVTQLMANCPLRNHIDIKNSLEVFEKNSHDFQISMFQFGWMNPWWAYRLSDKNNPEPLFSDELRNQRSQDQKPLYCPTGAIWVARYDKLMKEKTFYGEGFKAFIMDWKNAIDIDNYEDLEMALGIYTLINK